MVRRLNRTDIDAYVAIRREMLLDSPWAYTASPGFDRGSDACQLAESLARPDFVILGAFEAADLVAVASLDRESRPKRNHIAWLWGVYARPQVRGRGLGRAVVAAALDVARAWPGLRWVYLGVSENAPQARALYESFGFVAWGEEPDAIRVDGRSYAETHMRLDIATRMPPPA